MSYAVRQNLPIFKKEYVTPHNDKYYIKSRIGFDKYLGVFSQSGSRKDYFAYVDEYHNGSLVKDAGPKNGRLGRLDSMDVMRRKADPWLFEKETDVILIEVIPNDGDLNGFVPKLKSGYLSFRTESIEMTFLDWINFMKK